MEERKCTWCGNPACKQTVKGKHNEEAKGLPQNDGWFCQKCWDKGTEIENEAMYGDCLNGCKC